MSGWEFHTLCKGFDLLEFAQGAKNIIFLDLS